MHPGMTAFWTAIEEIDGPPDAQETWSRQRREVFATVLEGRWWGTITSEPGSGGDIARTTAVAHRRDDGLGYALTGEKHFGSGMGQTSYMVTTAVPEGEQDAASFYMNVEGAPWDGTAGIALLNLWDGHGMTATQSHAMAFRNYQSSVSRRGGRSRARSPSSDPTRARCSSR